MDYSDRVATSYIGGVISLRYGYTRGELTDVIRHSVTGANTWQRYHMDTDIWGNVTSIRVQGGSTDGTSGWNEGITLASYQYAGQNGYLERLTYGNGSYETYVYDSYGRIDRIRYYSASGSLRFAQVFTYDGSGNTARCRVVNPSGEIATEYRYCYDSLGRLIRSSEIQGSETRISTWHQYNGDNRLTQQSYQIGGSTFSESYTYNSADGSMATMTTASGNTLTYAYDGLNRLQSVSGPYTKTYAYRTVSGSQTTGQIASLTYGGFSNAPSFTYSYTADGNIAAESGANGSWTYRYDNQGQLTQAVNGSTTYSYAYDAAGNILSANGNTYTYGNSSWADLLTAYNGHAIAYEGQTLTSETSATGTVVSGNPVSYYNGTRWNFTWEGSRRLTSASSGGNTISFTYDVNGLRTSKTVNGTLHTYYYAGGRLLRETYGNNILDFAYDASGNPFSLTYNGAKYYYITNTQGDVFYLINTAGTVVASYTYDPYGKVLSASGSLASINPLRYRGYYYDSETGFYYLQSRYYDPAICRFINADSYSSTGQGFIGHNMFAYCGNNPVTGYDPTGEWDWGTFLSGVGLVATAVAAIAVAAPILACASAGALITAVAATTLAAGTLTAVNGAAEIAESVTGYNVVRDGAFGGDTAAYEAYRDTTAAVARIGTAICGAYTEVHGGNVCFVAGTAVLTATGTAAIEDIRAGDYVWAWDEETGDVALKKVVETYINETDELVHIHVNGEEIVCTPGHPFYSPVKGWTDAVNLRAGDILVLVNGEYVVVEKVQHELLESPVKAYNFQVEGYHTYYVSSMGVLVHNSCTRVGSGHGCDIHNERINKTMDYLEASGNYTKIYGNRSLNTAGLNGTQRPDIIAFDVNGTAHFWEFASPSQAFGSGAKALQSKIQLIIANNPGIVSHFVPW